MDRHPSAPHAGSAINVSALGARRGQRTPTDGGSPRGAEQRAALAAWLTAGRTARGMSREHVARVTRIQQRTLERLEAGRFDELPADVFVRGFIRNYALCVGLPVDDALARYAACGFAAAPVASAQAQAVIETLALDRPMIATVAPAVLVAKAPAPEAPAPEAIVPPPPEVVAATASATARKKGPQRDAKGRFIRKSQEMAAVEPPEDLEVEIEFVAEPVVVTAPVVVTPPPAISLAPTLTIDDDDPESAEREREERATRAREKDGGWRSFLPPALLDQDRGRQGGLTLAVIVLLIVATLALSYLMRRPSSTGEGVTELTPASPARATLQA